MFNLLNMRSGQFVCVIFRNWIRLTVNVVHHGSYVHVSNKLQIVLHLLHHSDSSRNGVNKSISLTIAMHVCLL